MNQETSSEISSIEKALRAHKVLFELMNNQVDVLLKRIQELESKYNDKIVINTTAIGNHITEKYGLDVEELNKRMLNLERKIEKVINKEEQNFKTLEYRSFEQRKNKLLEENEEMPSLLLVDDTLFELDIDETLLNKGYRIGKDGCKDTATIYKLSDKLLRKLKDLLGEA